jgi:probable O-glycosylation ligase (exosortase A-associated)
MRDLAFIGFIAALLALGLRRPFLFVLAFTYVDIVSPQRLSYYLLNSIPISLITAGLAIGGWLLLDDKRDFRIVPRQFLLLTLLVYAGVSTVYADFPVEAAAKWDWVWRALVWAIFLPLALRTKLRVEAYLLFMTLSAAAIIVVGGMKTAASGGGYGALNLMVDHDSGLYEGSILSTFAIALIPIILWLARYGTIFPRDWRVRTFAYCLIFACLLIPVGTEARTGLVCIAVMAVLMLRDVKRRFLYLGLVGAAGMMAVPFLPQSFTARMSTIQNYQADASAGTRLAVWGWTWDYVQKHPLGGGFDAYLGNTLRFTTTATTGDGAVATVTQNVEVDQGRAFHSSYFEMLGEHGFPGIILFLLIHGIGILRMEALRRRYRREQSEEAWIAPLATALQSAHIVYLVGSVFVGIAFQPFAYMLVGVQIGFDGYVKRKYAPGKAAGFVRRAEATRAVPA